MSEELLHSKTHIFAAENGSVLAYNICPSELQIREGTENN